MRHPIVVSSLIFLFAAAGCGSGGFHAKSITAPGLRSAEGDEIGFEPEREVPTEYAALWDGKHPDSMKWTKTTVLAIERHGENLLSNEPSDIKSYCPQFRTLDREEKMSFWVHLISVMAREESNFEPTKTYTESFNDGKGKPVVSRGLLQLSIESVQSPKYSCRIETEEELDDPAKNLVCGVKILNHWMGREAVIARTSGDDWYGASKYWGVFRKEKTRESIKKASSDLPICNSVRT